MTYRFWQRTALLSAVAAVGAMVSAGCGSSNKPINTVTLQGVVNTASLPRGASAAPELFRITAVSNTGAVLSTNLSTTGAFAMAVNEGLKWRLNLIKSDAPTVVVAPIRFPTVATQAGHTTVLPLDSNLQAGFANRSFDMGNIAPNNLGVFLPTNNPLAQINDAQGNNFATSVNVTATLAAAETDLEAKTTTALTPTGQQPTGGTGGTLTVNGTLSTIAGLVGTSGTLTDPLRFNQPVDLVLKPNGNLVVLDRNNQRTVEITSTGTFVETQAIYRWKEIEMDAQGNLYVLSGSAGSDATNFFPVAPFTVVRIPVTGTATTLYTTPTGHDAEGLGVDAQGNVYTLVQPTTFADTNVTTLVRITPEGASSDLTTFPILDCAEDVKPTTDNNVVVLGHCSKSLVRVSPTGEKTVIVTGNGLTSPRGLAVDSTGNMFVGSYEPMSVLRVTPTGTVTGAAGGINITGIGSTAVDGGPGTGTLAPPDAIVIDSAGSLYITQWNDHAIRKVTF